MRADARFRGIRGVPAVVLVTWLALASTACGGSVDPAASPASAQATRTPTGWVTHVYQHTAISVPVSWTVANEPLCWPASKMGLLVLGIHSGPFPSCPAEPSPGEQTVTVTPLSSPSSDAVAPPAVLQCPVMTVNGLKVHVGPCGSRDPGGPTWWPIRSLNVQLVATTGGGVVPEAGAKSVVDKVLHSVRRATPAEIATRSPLVTHLALAHARVRSGTSIKGTVTFTNTTSEGIEVEVCAADGWLNVGLAGNGIAFEPSHLLPACAPSVVLMPGRNAFPVTVLTTYLGCSNSEPPTAAFPMCVASVPPPLPVGIYRTVVATEGLPDDTVPANVTTVHLTH
jgi:hypothetical protein